MMKLQLSDRQKMLMGRAVKAAAVMSVVVAGNAMADGTDAVASNITSLQAGTITNIGLAVAAAFAVMAASLLPDIGLGLVKKWIKKGAS